jgi:hypothetical protein
MPKLHMPSDDEKKIIKQKMKYIEELNRILENEDEQARLIKDLADRMIKTANVKRDLVKSIENIVENLEIATRNPAAEIDKNEISSFKTSKQNLSDSLNNQKDLADNFLDLANVMRDFLKKKREYLKIFDKLVRDSDEWQGQCYKRVQMQNKFVDESKTRKVENQVNDLAGDIKRNQSQTDRKLVDLVEDAKTLDRSWNNIKNAIRKYGW